MVIHIRVTGMKEVRKFMNKLPKSMQKEVKEKGIPMLSHDLRRAVVRNFKIRGYGKGVSSTGASMRSIMSRKTKGGAVLEINAPWLVMIEQGFTKSHWVSPYTIKKHQQHPGSTVTEKAPEGQYGGKPVWWTYRGPFVQPAIIKWTPTIGPKLSRFVKRAIANSR